MDIWGIIGAIVIGGPVLIYIIAGIFCTAKFGEILFKDYVERKNK